MFCCQENHTRISVFAIDLFDFFVLCFFSCLGIFRARSWHERKRHTVTSSTKTMTRAVTSQRNTKRFISVLSRTTSGLVSPSNHIDWKDFKRFNSNIIAVIVFIIFSVGDFPRNFFKISFVFVIRKWSRCVAFECVKNSRNLFASNHNVSTISKHHNAPVSLPYPPPPPTGAPSLQLFPSPKVF